MENKPKEGRYECHHVLCDRCGCLIRPIIIFSSAFITVIPHSVRLSYSIRAVIRMNPVRVNCHNTEFDAYMLTRVLHRYDRIEEQKNLRLAGGKHL